MVRALASHQCGPGSIPGLGVICGLSLLLVLVLAPRGFSPGTPVFPSPLKTNISKFKFDLNTVEEEPPSGSTANPYCVVPENIHTPPTEGIFHMTPPPLWIFQKRPTNYTPPLRKFQFFPTPPGNISISCLKRKIS